MANLSEAEELELLELERERSMAGGPAAAEPSLARKAMQAVTMPVRGLRGAGVGAELLVEKALHEEKLGGPREKTLGEIAERAAAATEPGYKPKYGERLGAAAGEVVATAPAMAAAAPAAGAGLMAHALRGALSSGALTAVMEASERGDVEPVDVVSSSFLGGTVPLIGPSLRAIARVIRGAGKVATTSGTTLAKDAADELLDDPALLEQYKGTAEAVGERVKAIQKALVQQHEEAGALLQKARAKIGIQEPFEDSLVRVQRDGFKPTDARQVAQRFEALTADQLSPAMLKEARKGTYGEALQAFAKQASPGKTVTKAAKMGTSDRLRELFRLRGEVDDLINYPNVSADVPKIGTADQGFLKQMRGKINEAIEKIPEGKKLREADKIYSEARVLYDDFHKQIATQGKAEDLIQRILKGGEIEDAIGRKGEYARLIKQIEEKKKELLLEPARKELAARSFRSAEPNSWAGVLPMAGGAEGLASLLLGTRTAARVPDAAAVPFANSPFRAALQAAAAHSNRREGRR